MVAAQQPVVLTDGQSALEAHKCCFSSSVSASSIWRYQVAFETRWGHLKLCLQQRHMYSIDCRAALKAMGEELVDVERDREEGNCQDQFSSMILLEGPGMQGTNEEVSPDTSRC